jgi:hypothetical protein
MERASSRNSSFQRNFIIVLDWIRQRQVGIEADLSYPFPPRGEGTVVDLTLRNGGIGSHNSAKVFPSQRQVLQEATDGVQSGRISLAYLSF